MGAARSGGTLVYNMLCNSPDLNPALAENHFAPVIAQLYELSLSRTGIEGNHFFDGREDMRSFYAGLVAGFLEKQSARYAPAKLIAIKTLALGATMHVVHELLPAARFVVTVRDPRDIAASMVKVGKRQEEQGGTSQFPRDMNNLARQILMSYRVVLSNEYVSGRLGTLDRATQVVRYEDMVADPSGILSGLGRWLGVEIPECSGTPFARSRKSYRTEEERKVPFASEYWGQAVTDRTIGSYQDILTADETARISQLCRPIMERYGY